MKFAIATAIPRAIRTNKNTTVSFLTIIYILLKFFKKQYNNLENQLQALANYFETILSLSTWGE
jgi:hypothetical protein